MNLWANLSFHCSSKSTAAAAHTEYLSSAVGKQHCILYHRLSSSPSDNRQHSRHRRRLTRYHKSPTDENRIATLDDDVPPAKCSGKRKMRAPKPITMVSFLFHVHQRCSLFSTTETDCVNMLMVAAVSAAAVRQWKKDKTLPGFCCLDRTATPDTGGHHVASHYLN